MKKIPIAEFTDMHGQTEAARLLGMTQGALNKALKVGREIYVTKAADGGFSAEEVRPFPTTRRTQAA